MPDIPYEQMLQAELGTLALVLSIVLVATIGVAAVVVSVPVMKLLNRLADGAQTAQKDAQTALTAAGLAQTALQGAGERLTTALDGNTRELKAQTALLSAMGASIEAGNKATVSAITERLDVHDTFAREGMARIEAALEELKADLSNGHKALRGDILGKLDDVLAEVRRLHPPTPPPVALKPPDKLEREAA